MHPWHDLESGKNTPDSLNVIVEIPKGSRNKYELNKEKGIYEMSRTLYSPMIYPGDYGFIPRTYYEDNDPLDVLLMINEPTFPGCLIEVRPIGVFKMLDKGEPDDKILCVPKHNPYFNSTKDLSDVPPHFLVEVAHFFAVYKDLEGSRTLSLGWEGAATAKSLVNHAVELYNSKRDSLEGWLISETYQRLKLAEQEMAVKKLDEEVDKIEESTMGHKH